jgi:hypothetical protein
MLAHFEIAAAFTDSRTASTAVAFLGATFFGFAFFMSAVIYRVEAAFAFAPAAVMLRRCKNTSSGPCIAAGTMCSKFWIYVPIIYNP